jgi:hypothetical protein
MPARSADFAPLAIEAGYDIAFEPRGERPAAQW